MFEESTAKPPLLLGEGAREARGEGASSQLASDSPLTPTLSQRERGQEKRILKTILLSAGGTGGHLFPAEALAEELLSRGHKIIIVTDKRGKAFQSLADRVPVHIVRAATLSGGVVGTIKALVNMGLGVLQAGLLLAKYKPKIIVGFGGYPSFPAVFAGQIMGISTVLHEQNAILGKANAFLARRAVRIATSLPATRGLNRKSADALVDTGNPVRQNIVAVRDEPYTAPMNEFKIFVTGGSQGASILASIVPAACAALSAELKNKITVVQQARAGDLETVTKAYQTAGIKAEVKVFFDDMPQQLAACHLFIGRSGASTVAEMAVAGRPAIFVPFPHRDRQQTFNAEAITKKGGGWVIEQEVFTVTALAEKLQELINNPAMLETAAAAARSCGRMDAVQKLADLVETCA